MKKKRPTEDAAIKHAPMIEILASVAIAAMELVECVKSIDPNDNYEPSQRLSRQLLDQLEVLSAACKEYETLFKVIMVELPPGFHGVRIRNPYYQGKSKPSFDDDREGDDLDLGDDPF